MDSKKIQPVHPKWNQSWIFIGRTDAEAETPILWPPDSKNQLTGKDSDARKDWRQEEKGTTEDEIPMWWTWVRVGSRTWWWTGRPGVLQSMGSKRVGATEWLNWTCYNIYTSIGSVSGEPRFMYQGTFSSSSCHWLRAAAPVFRGLNSLRTQICH